MSKYILIAVLSFVLGQNVWAYPSQDGFTIGFGELGYFIAYSE